MDKNYREHHMVWNVATNTNIYLTVLAFYLTSSLISQ